MDSDAILTYTSKVDALVDRIDALLDHQQSAGNNQTIIHRTEGMGAWGSAAVVACFLTYLSLIIFAVWSIFQINNLTAWKDVYGRELAAMKQQQTTMHQEKAH
jgi:hypothetical protein